jgi:flagellar biosynthesis/type III secretory pathway M-ring protein FliF/YscJ
MDTGTKIDIGAGVGIGIFTVISVIITVYYLLRRRRRRLQKESDQNIERNIELKEKPELPGQSLTELEDQAAQLDSQAVNEMPGIHLTEMDGLTTATELVAEQHPVELPDTSLPESKRGKVTSSPRG